QRVHRTLSHRVFRRRALRQKSFMDLIRFCGNEGIKWGVTTNGGAFLNQKIVEQTVAAHPFNINISIDARDEKLHDYSRGVENSLRDIITGIGKVAKTRIQHGLTFPIIIKPVVHRLNVRWKEPRSEREPLSARLCACLRACPKRTSLIS